MSDALSNMGLIIRARYLVLTMLRLFVPRTSRYLDLRTPTGLIHYASVVPLRRAPLPAHKAAYCRQWTRPPAVL